MMYIFIASLIGLGLSVFIMWRNVMGLISTDTLVDAADTALGDNPVRTTRDNIYAGIRKHGLNFLIIIWCLVCTIVSGITWAVLALFY